MNIPDNLREKAKNEIRRNDTSRDDTEIQKVWEARLAEAIRHHGDNPIREVVVSTKELERLDPSLRVIRLDHTRSCNDAHRRAHLNSVAAVFMTNRSGITKITADALAAIMIKY